MLVFIYKNTIQTQAVAYLFYYKRMFCLLIYSLVESNLIMVWLSFLFNCVMCPPNYGLNKAQKLNNSICI